MIKHPLGAVAKIGLSTEALAVIALMATLKAIVNPFNVLNDSNCGRFNRLPLAADFSCDAKTAAADVAHSNLFVNENAVTEKEQDVPHPPLEYKILFVDLARSIGSDILREVKLRCAIRSLRLSDEHAINSAPNTEVHTKEMRDKDALKLRIGSDLVDILLRACCVELPRSEAIRTVYQEQQDESRRRDELRGPRLATATSSTSSSVSNESENVELDDSVQNNEISYSESLMKEDYHFMIQHPAAKAPNNVFLRAFRHENVYIAKRKTVGFFLIRSLVVRKIMSEKLDGLALCSNKSYYPMIQPPLPWNRQQNNGAYLLNPPQFIRQRKDVDSVRELLSFDCIPASLEQTTHRLGMQPWQINSSVLKVVEEVWRQGGGVGCMPPADFCRSPKKLEDQKANVALVFKLKLQLAQQFRNEESIYFPHSLDFRGRAYPVPGLMNHQGDDLCRSLLRFATARPLGLEGLLWFKIHLAGMFGHEKKSFDERLAWTNSQQERIRRVAADPLAKESTEFWTVADKPWQALANILEMGAILSSPDPVNFMSKMPVHQDGTCNGLQHYAALGRDVDGGKAVNLLPSEYPQDVYMLVLEACKMKLQKMVETLDTSSQKYCFARLVLDEDLLVRKVVKPPVMTYCYGLTSFGARSQVHKILKEMFNKRREKFCVSLKLSGFISSTILGSVDDIFRNAMKIKKWLDLVAIQTAKQHIQVSWFTATGLPCRQPYLKENARQTIISSRQTTSIAKKGRNLLIDASKQTAAFAPNYIHSLDASHMLMTAARCYDNGIAFAAVHDSFWTHAGDVPLMNKFLREEFYNLHNKHCLQDLFFANSYRGIKGLNLPPQVGNLDLMEVLKSRYFFC